MKTNPSGFQLCRRVVGVAFVALVFGQVQSVAAQDRSEKLRRFEVDSQACQSGKTGQTYASCMKEAKAVLADRPGSNPSVSPEQLRRNALARCDAQTGDDRAACIARAQGEGTVSGSVAGGGVLREVLTKEVASPPQHPASASTGK